MNTQNWPNPFHAGERSAQERAGAGDVAQWAGGFVRDYLPEQHRKFHTSLPFLVVASSDDYGRIWTTLVEGEDGFIQSPDPRSLILQAAIDRNDPLAARFATGGDVGVVGIELGTRRRNRFNGNLRPKAGGYTIKMHQTFGNCPQYIHERSWHRAPHTEATQPEHSSQLSDNQIARIQAASTLFIGSGQYADKSAASSGYDASHRGGARGFVNVPDGKHLQIPDYAGNNFFNTIGNITADPRVGLLFVDFETGGLLHVSGRAEVEWSARNSHDPDAWRMINIEIDAVIDRPAAVSLRWNLRDHSARKLRLVRREAESRSITSFYFSAADGRPLDPYLAGQHLPISVQIPGQAGLTNRSYSLSASPTDRTHYRLSIKREAQGVMSRFLHDHLRVGDMIEAQAPSGDFGVPHGESPVVLISAGVGLTPMVSMLHELAKGQRPVWYVHGAKSSLDHAARQEVEELIAETDNLHQKIFYSRPDDGDIVGHAYDVEGRITSDHLLALGAGPDARYMICGPAAFISGISHGLEAEGVPANHILFETFGPSG